MFKNISLPPCKLPLIISKGRFQHLSLLDCNELESFLSYLIRFTCKEFGLEITHMPSWWTESVMYHPDFARGTIPAPECRNLQMKLRRLIKLCYLHYDCKSLLIMSEQLATLHHRSYKFMMEPSGNVAVYRTATMTVLVRIPSSNLNYDLDRIADVNNRNVDINFTLAEQREVSLTPRPTITSLLSPKKPVEPTEEVIVLDSSSESDDEVQIVSYEPGALPPTPPKNRPGPACSKIRPAVRPLFGAASVQQRLAQVAAPGQNCQVHGPLGYQPNRQLRPQGYQPNRQLRPQGYQPNLQLRPQGYQPNRQLRPQGYQPYRPQWLQGHQPSPYRVHPQQGYVPYRHPPPQQRVPARSKYLQCRPRRNINIEKVDLTVDDDEDEDIVQPTGPKDLSQSDFLARMGLGDSSNPDASIPKKKLSPPVIQKNKRLNVRDIPFTMVPHLVSIGYLPRRAMCSQAEVLKRTEFIDKYTAKDTNWFLVTVDTKDKKAVAAVVRKCWVSVKRLNSADMRRWRKRFQESNQEI